MGDLKVKLLIEHILNSRNSDFSSILFYANELGATDKEVEEALIESGKVKLGTSEYQHLLSDLYDKVEKKENRSPHFLIKRFKNLKNPIKLFSILIVFLIIATTYYIISPHKLLEEKPNLTVNTQPPEKQHVSGSALGAPVVYASQKVIDAKKTFSYPPTQISLKYEGKPKKEVFGFLPYWMADVFDEISIEEYSTISIFGLTTDSAGNILTNTKSGEYGGWDMWNDARLNQFITKAKQKRVKMLITLKSFDNKDIEALVLSDEAHKTFISNAIQLMNAKSLSGINIDFEYVGNATPEVTNGFTRLLANLNAEMKRQVPDASLSVDTYASSASAPTFFDIELLQNYVDSIIVMAYDIHTPKSTPGPIAPLEGGSGIIGYIQSYLERVDPKKVILGVPYYAYDWPDNGAKDASDVQILSYAEVSQVSKSRKLSWDEQAKTPYYEYIDTNTNQGRVVHFENTRSLGLKYDYVNTKNLGGIAVWAIGYEGRSNELEQLILEKFAQ